MSVITIDCTHLHGAFGAGCPHCTAPRPVSPCCKQPMEGGPVIFWCTGCRHDVHGSVIDREVPLNAAAKPVYYCPRCGRGSSSGPCGCGGGRS